eukprot:289519_1
MAVSFETERWIVVTICALLPVLMALMLIRLLQFLSCKGTIKVNDKYVFVRVIRKHKSKIRKQRLKITFAPCIRYTTIICVISYFCANIFAISSMIGIDLTKHSDGNSATDRYSFELQQAVAFIFWYMGRILMHAVFVERLKTSFKDTKWTYSSSFFRCLYAIIIIIFLIYLIQVALLIRCYYIFDRFYIWITIVNHYLLIALDITYSIVLYILFQRKVFQLITSYYVLFQNVIKPNQSASLDDVSLDEVIQQRDTSQPSLASASVEAQTPKDINRTPQFYNVLISDSIVVTTNHDDVRDIVDERNKRITSVYNHTKLESINTITQYTVLICVSLITSLVPTTISLLAAIEFSQDKEYIAMHLFYVQVAIAIDCFMNAFCLYLHFPFSLRLYKCVCRG